MARDEGLVKVRVRLADHGRWRYESLWAKPLGDDLYELRNTPWLADGLHHRDVVRCAPSEQDLPEVVDVVRRPRD